jgi:hypothetical protein
LIIEIPNEHDFHRSATGLLNSAWGEVVDLISEFSNISDVAIYKDFDEIDSERYWDAAKQALASSSAMVQQAVEFYIKGRIVSISPFLLISGSPISTWPKNCTKHDICFSDFRTVDAQDLIRLHDAVYPVRFTEEFSQWFTQMRTLRNRIMHSIDHKLFIKPEVLIESILYAHNYFSPGQKWMKTRSNYLDNTPVNSVKYFQESKDHDSYVLLQIHEEARTVIGKITPSIAKKYFGYIKKKRRLYCPSCYQTLSNMDLFDSRLMDNILETFQKVDSSFYSCFICDYSGELIREECTVDRCGGKLIDKELRICLSCGSKSL